MTKNIIIATYEAIKSIVEGTVYGSTGWGFIFLADHLGGDIEVRRSVYDGVGIRILFPNGWGVDVVSHSESIGGADGEWEIAVIDSSFQLRYDTDITDDVLGYCDQDDVWDTINRVAALEKE